MAAKLQKLFSAPVSSAKDFADALEIIAKEKDSSILSNNFKLYIDAGMFLSDNHSDHDTG